MYITTIKPFTEASERPLPPGISYEDVIWGLQGINSCLHDINYLISAYNHGQRVEQLKEIYEFFKRFENTFTTNVTDFFPEYTQYIRCRPRKVADRGL